MDNIISWLSGAGSAGNQAADKTGGYYQTAMNNVINSTGTGSPAATTFGNQEVAALQPRFDQQQQALAAKEAAMGITNSGAAHADYTQLGSDQAATLAGSVAPLYSSAMNSYDSINASQPGAQSGAYNNAYQNAIQNFYAGLQDAAGAAVGAPPTASVSGGNFNAGQVAPQLGVQADGTPIYDESTLATSDTAAANANPYGVSAPPSQYSYAPPFGGL